MMNKIEIGNLFLILDFFKKIINFNKWPKFNSNTKNFILNL